MFELWLLYITIGIFNGRLKIVKELNLNYHTMEWLLGKRSVLSAEDKCYTLKSRNLGSWNSAWGYMADSDWKLVQTFNTKFSEASWTHHSILTPHLMIFTAIFKYQQRGKPSSHLHVTLTESSRTCQLNGRKIVLLNFNILTRRFERLML